MTPSYVINDGGRAAAGFKGSAGDCVARSIAIASGLPYADVYKRLADETGAQRVTKGRKAKGATARRGINVKRKWFKDYMASIGATWTPTMAIGSGCKVHLNAKELPAGRLVVSVSKHYTAVIDGVVHDTFDPRDRGATVYTIAADEDPKPGWRFLRDTDSGRHKQYVYDPERCVYGYWTFGALAASDESRKQFWVPAKFWSDHSDRCPCDNPDSDMATELRVSGNRTLIEATPKQIEVLRRDAAFYCDPSGPDECPPGLVRSAAATVKAIELFKSTA